MANENHVYASFARLWGNGHPLRSSPELMAAVRAAGIAPEAVTDDWLRRLSRAWVYYETEDPFDDEQNNRAYRRELRQLLA